jgi:hypothetical protein
MEAEQLVTVAKYPTIFDAERAKARLESEGIDAMVQAHAGTGVFGAGYQGPVPGGAAVLVRSSDVDRAWSVVVDHR